MYWHDPRKPTGTERIFDFISNLFTSRRAYTVFPNAPTPQPVAPPPEVEAVKNKDFTAGFHSIFLSHTGSDKPFVRQLQNDLLDQGVPRVWVDEAEIEIGDSLISKIDEGMKHCRYIAVVLSKKSIDAPWVKKELDAAMNREISTGEIVVLPLLYEKCDLPIFLQGKLYADFTNPDGYQVAFAKLLRRLRKS